MSIFVPDVHPTLVLNAHSAISDEQLHNLLLGIEEEGVPVTIHRSDQMNPLTLAHDAAVESVLDVGLGIALDYAVVTTDKLPEERPYMAHFFNYTPQADRAIGSNAARLVKRVPLHDVEDR